MIAACAQLDAKTMDRAAEVWPIVERLAIQAAAAGADLLVLPEITYPAYWLESVERYHRDDIERSESVLRRYSRLATRHRFWLAAGFVEEAGDRLHNSAVLFDREGQQVGVARKNFLWDCDHKWFTAGDRLSVFDSEFGPMGVLICADARVPEIPATLVSRGAQLIVEPTAWVNTSSVRRTYRNIQPDFLIQARAREFGVPFVCASKAGREAPNLEYVGQSRIVLAEGTVAATAALGGDELVSAEFTPAPGRPPKLNDEERTRLLGDASPFAPKEPGTQIRVQLSAETDALAGALTGVGARVAHLSTGDLERFAPARCRALDGAQVLIATGRLDEEIVARTRAAENRVFLITAEERPTRVIHPSGAVVWRASQGKDGTDLDLAEAERKEFTPSTHLWAQRQPSSYRFDAPC